jgi:hypothetical protein
LAKPRGWPVHVISRVEKKILSHFCENWALENSQDIHVQNIDGSNEWMDSVLQSQAHWDPENILVLPDTRFAPLDVIDQMAESLKTQDLCFALHEVDEKLIWGVVEQAPDQVWISEKPQKLRIENSANKNQAWGLIGFRPRAGANIFTVMKIPGWHPINGSCSFLELSQFHDLTRTK